MDLEKDGLLRTFAVPAASCYYLKQLNESYWYFDNFGWVLLVLVVLHFLGYSGKNIINVTSSVKMFFSRPSIKVKIKRYLNPLNWLGIIISEFFLELVLPELRACDHFKYPRYWTHDPFGNEIKEEVQKKKDFEQKYELFLTRFYFIDGFDEYRGKQALYGKDGKLYIQTTKGGADHDRNNFQEPLIANKKDYWYLFLSWKTSLWLLRNLCRSK